MTRVHHEKFCALKFMDGTFEYYIRLSGFRNIDLPLQGVYFIQIALSYGTDISSPIELVPYSASNNVMNIMTGGNIHSLFPPQISREESLQSSGFIIQYSDEQVSLTDAFRISVKRNLVCTREGNSVVIERAREILDAPLQMQIDLLFSNGSEVGGLDGIITSPMTATFPTEYTIVATQKYMLQNSDSAEFFRIPLGLLREQYSTEEEDNDFVNGEIFPCAFLEGIVCSTMTKLEFPRASTFGSKVLDYIHQKSTEVCFITR